VASFNGQFEFAVAHTIGAEAVSGELDVATSVAALGLQDHVDEMLVGAVGLEFFVVVGDFGFLQILFVVLSEEVVELVGAF